MYFWHRTGCSEVRLLLDGACVIAGVRSGEIPGKKLAKQIEYVSTPTGAADFMSKLGTADGALVMSCFCGLPCVAVPTGEIAPSSSQPSGLEVAT
jgi:hypothetical protein